MVGKIDEILFVFVLSLRTLSIQNDLSSCCNVCLLLLLLALTWVCRLWVYSLSSRTTLYVCIPRRIPTCRRCLRGPPSPSRGQTGRSAPCANPWTWRCPSVGSPSERPRLSVVGFTKRRLEFTSRTMLRVLVSGESVWELTVTPAMMGDFPSISLKTSASASSALFSLYFFLASSVSATLNSSYVMLREDFFLEAEVGKGAFNARTRTSEDRNAAARSSALVSLRPLAHWIWESREMYTEPCAMASAWKMEDGILLG